MFKVKGVNVQIGELAKRVGMTTQTIRFYEQRGLLGVSTSQRSASNYRVYGSEAVARLQTIAAAKTLGFTLKQILSLARLWESGQLGARARVQVLQEKLEELNAKRNALDQLEKVIHQKLERLEFEANGAPKAKTS